MDNHEPKASSVLGSAFMPDSREWSELNDSEKIERLRQQFQANRYLVQRIAELEASVHLLRNHQHINGDVVIRIENANARSTLVGQSVMNDPLR